METTEISVKFIFTKILVGVMRIILEVKSEWKNILDPKMVIFGSFCPKWSENDHFRIKKSIFYWKFQKVLTANYFTDIYWQPTTDSLILLTANFSSEKFTASDIFNLGYYYWDVVFE